MILFIFIGGKIMLRKKGFTLIELMVVILIVSILAAVAIPIMRGRIDAAKWSEGKAMAGTIATSLRAYYAEKGEDGVTDPSLTQLGFAALDLTGTYFSDADFTWTGSYVDTRTPPVNFLITVLPGTQDDAPNTPSQYTLDHLGEWVETP